MVLGSSEFETKPNPGVSSPRLNRKVDSEIRPTVKCDDSVFSILTAVFLLFVPPFLPSFPFFLHSFFGTGACRFSISLRDQSHIFSPLPFSVTVLLVFQIMVKASCDQRGWSRALHFQNRSHCNRKHQTEYVSHGKRNTVFMELMFMRCV